MEKPDVRADSQNIAEVMPLMLEEARAAFGALAEFTRIEQPDLVVFDVPAWAGWALARKLDIPAICSWPVFASNEYFSLHREYVSFEEKDMAAMFGGIAAFIEEAGLRNVSPQDFFESDADRNIVLFTREFQPCGETFYSRFTFVTPCIREPERSVDADWLRAAKPLAAVSLGTIYTDNAEFYRTCLAATDRLGWHTAVSLGNTVRQSDLGPVSERVLLRERLPMIDTLRHASAFLAQGGLSSAMEAIAHGVPLLIAPEMGERRAVADRVAELGLGVVLPDSFTADELAELLTTVFREEEMARRLAEFRRGMPDGRGAGEFADAVEAEL